ncbi:radical SAM family heme chaperone HemW [Candidatus Soleaferrea massiliensis]|uniref:radical SAM family heme chaperone HemW n=1 Tax=Candidatus Soleaferrea massiliensis TaxID=1470354 RepID=UPI00058C45BB|nr:radical SAM family heme chaperone HemW [Candidatus Soleaferrea massiliensis]
MKPIGVYIHIPFCASKCPYCDFYSVQQDDSLMDRYLDALCTQVRRFFARYPALTADSVYFGGGTPILMRGRLCRILETLGQTAGLRHAEITLEANPYSTMRGTLRELYAGGFNRVSFGVQSGLDAELKALGRTHTVREAGQAIMDAQDAGFTNISADLMLGIPYQTSESLDRSISFLTETGIGHLSAYLLKVEEGTPFRRSHLRRFCADDDRQAEFYLQAVRTLEGLGFRQYEISNFAKPGRECRHNLKYWNCDEYIGFGPSAHSYLDGQRFYTGSDLMGYLSGIERRTNVFLPESDGGSLEEYLLLRLRLNEGVRWDDLHRRYPHAQMDAVLQKAQALSRHALTETDEHGIRLTTKGFLLSNAVIAELLDELIPSD